MSATMTCATNASRSVEVGTVKAFELGPAAVPIAFAMFPIASVKPTVSAGAGHAAGGPAGIPGSLGLGLFGSFPPLGLLPLPVGAPPFDACLPYAWGLSVEESALLQAT